MTASLDHRASRLLQQPAGLIQATLWPLRLAALAAAACAALWLATSAAQAAGSAAEWTAPAVPVADDEGTARPDTAGAWAPEALDVNALTNDQSINTPTGWWVYTAVTEAQINGYLDSNNARLTGIELHSIVAGIPRFTVRMVRNTGAYAIAGWGWWYGQTAFDVVTKLNQFGARLIDIEPYDAGGGQLRYAIITVPNSGAGFRVGAPLFNRTLAQIDAHLDATGQRLVDLDHTVINGVKRYTAITVANTGADAKPWVWYVNRTGAQVAAAVSAFNGRIVKMDRQPDGRWHIVLVRNTGADATAWWYRFDFTSTTALLEYANQLAIRPVHISTFLDGGGTRRYAAAFIDNANTSTRRVRSAFATQLLDSNGNPTRGIFAAYLKRIDGPGGVRVDLNSRRRAETASSLKSLHLLHAMRRVMFGQDTLGSAFTYWDYVPGDETTQKNACPNPALEVPVNERNNFNFEGGLDNMMSISDNRTTRGVVVRYGGFAPFNGTASFLGLKGTTLRHNIGCSYRNLSTGDYEPATRRNDTTAADLARIYEGVWMSTFLDTTNNARAEFLESANPSGSAGSGLQAIIDDEAAKQGKSAIAAEFGALVERWGKGGSYDTCLPNASGGCGQKVVIRSGTGLVRLPVKSALGVTLFRTYSFARFISDVPVFDWDAPDAAVRINAYSTASNELLRDEIRLALQTW